MKKWTCIGTVCLALILAIVLGMSKSSPATTLETTLYEAAKKEGKLILWDSIHLREAVKFFNAFKKRYPGIEISFWQGNAMECDNKYFAETLAGRKPVDLLQVEWYNRYKKEGRLTNLSDIIKDTNFSDKFASKDFDAVAVEHTLRASAYNTDRVSAADVPRTWEDLLDPKWKGQIAVEINMGAFINLTGVWGEEKLVSYLRKLGEQNPIFTKGASYTITLLGAGEFPIAVNILLHRIVGGQNRGMPIDMVPFSPIVDRFAPFAIVRDAPHPNAAKLYLRWLMSDGGQSMMDKVRMKANPMPGSGTLQSNFLEKKGIKVLTVRSWEVDTKQLQMRYQAAIGYSKDKKVREDKKKKKK